MSEQLPKKRVFNFIWYVVLHFIPAITRGWAVSKKILSAYNLLALTTSTTTVVRALDDTG